ncbi:hypothetical protein NDU88_001043 [Pleurodeles waltl]|uniref:Uncharacterized protein n=1 Tax=Pleurodeles waltl TaxID=8319 RepID=A0AAV7WL67_PLEWA|nr:hypothetical protein NDU88_001043 [Pleurodeles waltl]
MELTASRGSNLNMPLRFHSSVSLHRLSTLLCILTFPFPPGEVIGSPVPPIDPGGAEVPNPRAWVSVLTLPDAAPQTRTPSWI